MKLHQPEEKVMLTIRYGDLDQLKLKEEEEKQDVYAHKVQDFNTKVLQKPMKLYRLDKIVAHGTFGIVYRATKANTEELVAIKRVYQDGRYKNRELDILKTVCRYSEANEFRTFDQQIHPNVLFMRHYFLDVDINQDTYLNIVSNFYPETLHSQITKFYRRNR